MLDGMILRIQKKLRTQKKVPNDSNDGQQPQDVGMGKGEDEKEDNKQLDDANGKKGTNDGKKEVCKDRKKRCNKNNCKKAKLRSLMKRDCASTCGFCPAVSKGGKNGNTGKGNTGKGNTGKGKGRRGRGTRGKRGGKKPQTKPKRGRGQPKKPKKQSEVQAR
ncbi:hypothetical protein M3Y94_00053000 [Aphelenchoides besseyi]|nr:hypothetical protein M3Y94_00053000 [Aphelenchoides besseyi]